MIRTRRRASRLVAGCALSLLCLAPVDAEENTADKVRTFLVLRLTEALDLTDEKALEVRRIIHESEERRRRLATDRAKIEEGLREALGRPSRDTATLDPLIAEANRIDQELALLPEKNYLELQAILTTEQRAKLVLFRREMRSEVRRAIERRR